MNRDGCDDRDSAHFFMLRRPDQSAQSHISEGWFSTGVKIRFGVGPAGRTRRTGLILWIFALSVNTPQPGPVC